MAIRFFVIGPVNVIRGVAAPSPAMVPSRSRKRGRMFWMEK